MRLIDADAYTKEIINRIEAAIKWETNAMADRYEEIKIRAEEAVVTFCEAALTVKKMPTIEAEPVRHGGWKSDRLVTTNGCTYGVRRCSECEAYYQDIGYGWKYCPNCGALMDKEET